MKENFCLQKDKELCRDRAYKARELIKGKNQQEAKGTIEDSRSIIPLSWQLNSILLISNSDFKEVNAT